ncbi:PAC2 family protein [Candidatus Bathyarchaeota archaeon]|nr:PAC2 family protein [Candidatus Bathyarchaeota archaeon]
MEEDTWIRYYGKTVVEEPVAIVGSPGLRSIGKIVVALIAKETRAKPLADLYSSHLPLIYETRPSYAAHPALPGIGGVKVRQGMVELPKVQFYACPKPSLIMVEGCHPNFAGQYQVAQKTVDFIAGLGTKMVVVTAGYGSKERKVCCAATSQEVLSEMKKKLGVEVDYQGPFYGFSGLVFGMAKRKGIKAITLFAGTTPHPQNPEYPDLEGAKKILNTVRPLLQPKKA